MGGKKDDEKDLRKEVEMTEHTDSIEKVCQQYQTCAEKGLTDSAVEDVSLNQRYFHGLNAQRAILYEPYSGTDRLGNQYVGNDSLLMSLKLYISLEKIDRNRPKISLFSNSFEISAH